MRQANATGDSASESAQFLVSGKACGALPRRRYDGKGLKSFLGCRSRRQWGLPELAPPIRVARRAGAAHFFAE